MSLVMLSCDRVTTWSNNNPGPGLNLVEASNDGLVQDSKTPAGLFTLPDAIRILGEPAHLSDSSTTTNAGILTYRCSFTANSKDEKSGKTGVVYLLFEHYNQVDSAKKKYTFIKTANKDHGITVLHDLGDEAYFHTDKTNFYFVMARKGRKVFNMKVNKITSSTSLDEFNKVAKQITDAL